MDRAREEMSRARHVAREALRQRQSRENRHVDDFDCGWAAGVAWARDEVRGYGSILEVGALPVMAGAVPAGEIWFVDRGRRQLVGRITNDGTETDPAESSAEPACEG